MSNQIFAYPYPRGVDDTLRALRVRGSILLAGAAVSTGEPLNWAAMVAGIPYNETNFVGKGTKLNKGSALVTTFSGSGTVVTATAANNFSPGQFVTFAGNTSTLGLLLNGLTFTVITASTTQFTFASTASGSGTGEVGFAYSGKAFQLLAKGSQAILATVTSLAVSGGIITVTAANSYLPGAQVTFSGLGTALGLLMNGVTFTVKSSIGTTFAMTSVLTGSAGSDTGTATGRNPPQPDIVNFWSANGSGYIYQYAQATGVLYAMQSGAGTPAGTIVSISTAPTITTASGDPATAPVGVISGALAQTAGASGITGVQAPVITSTFTGSAGTAAALAKLAAAAYPAGVLGDIIKFEAVFGRGL